MMLIMVVLVVILFEPVSAVTCYYFRQRRDGVQRSLDTCTGDYCFTYTAILNIGYDQGCVTGIVLPTQCWNDRSGILCVCSTEMCNTPENRDAGELQNRTQCLNDFTLYDPTFGGVLTQPYNNYNLDYGSATCDVQGWMKNFGASYQTGQQYRGEPFRGSGSFRILTGSSGYYFAGNQNWGQERGRFTLFYYGGFYVSDYGSGTVGWFSRCRTEQCNTWNYFSISILEPTVRCKASNFAYSVENGTDFDSCEGQMCAIMTSYVKAEETTYQSHFCFLQNSDVAEYPILVGHYSNMNVLDFSIENFYLCAEDNCNIDVLTAQASIEKYKKSHEGEYPPRRNPRYVP